MIDVITDVSLWELIKHAGSWVANLNRAKGARKEQSKSALRKVVLAARKTSVYMRQLQDTGQRSHKAEGELTMLWTELSYDLEDLGIEKLAKRCRIKGKYWSDPDKMDKDFLEKADVGLERMEQLASDILRNVSS